ncbi:MAG: hypothetical protein CL554_16200 [Algoriphagus sp.]|uniref:hypothetical protein n=1 Tax=Algoriphagus sp. TaxID=1872435 RepID=UPI000C5E3C8F|nr:hypothetical protein [Algoriphagus sp.]MAL14958.1 hypothetical protein [Algoriphagus sp.]
MKEIFNNWNKFVNEQQPKTAEQRLDMFARAVLDLNTAADDKKWQTVKARASKFPLNKVANMVRDKIYNTFDSDVGEKSFVRFAMANKEQFTSEKQISEQEVLEYYKSVVLPKIKKVIYEIPIVNVATTEASQLYSPGVEFVAKRLQKGDVIGGFFGQFSGTPPFVGINPYAYIDDRGLPNIKEVTKAISEELAHAVDGLIKVSNKVSKGYFFSDLLSGDIEKIIKKQEDTNLKDKDYYDYLKDPMETYAKLKVIKSELMGINKKLFFDDEGKIVLRHVKAYLEDPKNKDRHPILKVLNIQKLEDIGKVLDQIARVDRQKTSQMA